MARWTRFVLRFRWPVLAFWLVVLLAGGFATSKLTPLLSNTFTVPGTDSERARTILQEHFGDRSDDPVPVRRGDDHGDARNRLHLRALHDDGDLRHESRAADRTRNRDRLFAPDRLSVPRGARARRHEGRRDRAHDGDGGTRGDLLRRDRCDRAGAAALHAVALHALDGRRRLPDPARLDRRGRNAAAGTAVCVRAARDETRARRRLAAAQRAVAAALRRAGRRAWLLGSAGTLDHASADRFLRGWYGRSDRRRCARVRSPADAGISPGDSAIATVGAWPERAPGGGRARRTLADA